VNTKELVRSAGLAVVGLAAGIFFLVEGLGRSGDERTRYLFVAVAILGCLISLAGMLHLRWQERGLSAEGRAETRAARLELARQSRPGWSNSRGYAVLAVGGAAYWAYSLGGALRKESYGLAVLDALICLVCVMAALRVVRRRRPADQP
jgi:hypothetical protein